jgi:hypothetical protein
MAERIKENKMQLLQDTFIIENLQVLNEGKTSDKMKIRGVFGRCNEKNNNGRIYPTAVLESQLAKVQPLINERRLCGELDHPQNDTVKLSNASHLITKLDMKGNELIGEAEILKTPAGLTAQALVNGGVKIGISSRGMGTLSENEVGEKVVNEDFRLVTFDLVADPSTRGAFPGLSESTQSQFAKETQGKLQKESNFVTLLENKMKESYKTYLEEETALQRKIRLRQEGKTKTLAQLEAEQKKTKPARPTKQQEAFELVKADGHWHRIANILKEALLDEVFGGDNDEDDAASREKAAKAETQASREARRTERAKSSISGALKRRMGASIEHGGEMKRAASATQHAQKRAGVEQEGGIKRTARASQAKHSETLKSGERAEQVKQRKHKTDKAAVTRGAEMQVHQSGSQSQANVRKTKIQRAAKAELATNSTEYEQFGEILKENFDLDAKY